MLTNSSITQHMQFFSFTIINTCSSILCISCILLMLNYFKFLISTLNYTITYNNLPLAFSRLGQYIVKCRGLCPHATPPWVAATSQPLALDIESTMYVLLNRVQDRFSIGHSCMSFKQPAVMNMWRILRLPNQGLEGSSCQGGGHWGKSPLHKTIQ